MNLVLTVLEIVAPVFLLAGIGFAWVRLGHEYRINFVTKLAMTLGTPALIFTALMQTEIDPSALTSLSLATAAAYAAVCLVFFVILKLRGLNLRSYLAPLTFGNTGNLGLPLALFAFGDTGLSYAVVVFAIMAIGSFTFGLWLVSGGGSPVAVLKDPILLGTLAGTLFLVMGWQTPTFLTNTLELIAQLAIPLMLLTLGVAVARLRPAGFLPALGMSLVKLVASVALALGIGLALKLEPVALAVLVVQLSTPVAVSNYLLAEKYDTDPNAVAGLVVVSTLLSVLALPVILAFFV
ncbi:AEC family transporter [Maritimibacter sp. UBA3975]|uniref:AEC family transporter n=1 Tax=Maritimibacter sp. UBA3975 TaxID=1946833 RepID=UPI000C0A2766|nr:AEC family transporter [Maritimibacter sp. UBA3975]MAM62486.1 transporter [Maritimibacter sp.]